MTERELQKEFSEKWKQENPTRYVVWLICYIGDLVPLAIAGVQFMGGLTDKKVGTIAVCLVVVLVLAIISAVINRGRNREWKAYREANKGQLK